MRRVHHKLLFIINRNWQMSFVRSFHSFAGERIEYVCLYVCLNCLVEWDWWWDDFIFGLKIEYHRIMVTLWAGLTIHWPLKIHTDPLIWMHLSHFIVLLSALRWWVNGQPADKPHHTFVYVRQIADRVYICACVRWDYRFAASILSFIWFCSFFPN